MTHVFTAKTRPTHTSKAKQTRRVIANVMMSLILPVVVIVSVVTISWFSTDGETVGYGQGRCYLNNGLLVGMHA